jgi:predicted  nucleic acid-binding Zn-ribbon protein
MPDFTDLKKRVAKQTDIQNSVLALLTGIVNEVQRVVRLQARAEDLADQLVADAPDLAEAVAKNLASEGNEVESTVTERLRRLEGEFDTLEGANARWRDSNERLVGENARLQKEIETLRANQTTQRQSGTDTPVTGAPHTDEAKSATEPAG